MLRILVATGGEHLLYAVVNAAGMQYRVSENSRVRVPRLEAEAGASIQINDVLLVADGDKVTVGTPTVEGAFVEAKVLAHGRGKKTIVFKMKRRKGYRRKTGHRRLHTDLQITRIHRGAQESSER